MGRPRLRHPCRLDRPTGFELVKRADQPGPNPLPRLQQSDRIGRRRICSYCPQQPIFTADARRPQFSVWDSLEGGLFTRTTPSTVLLRSAFSCPSRGGDRILDMNLHFTGAQGLTAETADRQQLSSNSGHG